MNKLQQFVQDKCIMAVHSECETLDEAKGKEFGMFCKIKVFENLDSKNYEIVQFLQINKFSEDKLMDIAIVIDENNRVCMQYYIPKKYIKKTKRNIVGLPCTLARIMTAIDRWGNYGVIAGMFSRIHRKKFTYDMLCPWKFIKDDGTDALFEDQTEETQLEIAKRLGWKERNNVKR